MKKTNLYRNLAALIAMAMLVTALSGCAGNSTAGDVNDVTVTKTYTEDMDTAASEPTDVSAETRIGALDRIQRIQEQQANNSAQEPETATAQQSMSRLDNISKLGNLVGDMSLLPDGSAPYVDVDNAHNPYDLTWQYGKMTPAGIYDQTSVYGWGDLYQSYMDACDWSLVFDAEYYKSAFPVLAELYHYDDALLLEHFQTVGVHEGRQGNESFNVAAYMDHCAEEVWDAFGDNYECYYFYWMLNQDTEKSVVTTGDYRTWQTVELSWFQQDELEHVNAYRAEVGANPVVIDPEMVAFACIRAWYDAVGNVKAHDNLYHQSVDDAMDGLGILEFYENTSKYHAATCGCNTIANPWKRFHDSTKGHYEAMVLDTQHYFGSSNSYVSSQSGSKCVAVFDMFTPETPKTSR